jgi:DNA repair protein RAD5
MSYNALFFPGSDDEETTIAQTSQNRHQVEDDPEHSPVLGKRPFFADSKDEDSTHIPASYHVPPPNETRYSDIIVENRPVVEDEPTTSIVSNVFSASVSAASSPPYIEAVAPPQKKPRPSPITSVTPSSTYLGSFLVGNAWSTVKGKNYVQPGDKIKIDRDEPEEATSSKANSLKADGKGKGKFKQLSIATLMKSQPPKLSNKKKVDSVVRLTNSRGFG